MTRKTIVVLFAMILALQFVIFLVIRDAALSSVAQRHTVELR